MKKVNVNNVGTNLYVRSMAMIAIAISLVMSSCEGGGGSSNSVVGGILSDGKFDGNYKYNPPTTNYHIKWTNTWKYDNGNKTKTETSFAACIGKGYAANFTDESVTYIDFETGRGWSRLANETKWYEDDYDYSDTEDPSDVGPLSAMEDFFMRYFRAYGFEDSELSKHYVGNEKVAGINCWVFDTKSLNAITMKYWIDPSNGCCLKHQNTESGDVTEVIYYDLIYTAWTDNLKYQ